MNLHNIFEHPATSLAGLAMIIATGVATLYPQYASLIHQLTILFGAGTLAIAKDPNSK